MFLNHVSFYGCLFIIVLLNCSAEAQNPDPIDDYPYLITLKRPDLIYMYWKHDNEEITFEIHYKNTTRWVLFGISGANYSDVVFGWLNKDGTGHFADAQWSNRTDLKVDSRQDWLIKDAYAQNNYNILIFKRKIMICDWKLFEDLDIQQGANKILYGYGQLADDNNGNLIDFNISSIEYINQLVLLLQTDGPFNCQNISTEQVFTSISTDFYSNYIDLIDNGIYRLYWNYTTVDFIGEIHVRTNGWVGFGFSPNGEMNNSDVIIGWIDDKNGSVYFTDNFIKINDGGELLSIDSSQDYTLLYSAQNKEYTIFKFQRKLVTCDQNDRDIETGSPYLIFTYQLTDPSNVNASDWIYSINKGVKSVNLISGMISKEIFIPNVETFEYSVNNVFLPKSSDTFSYCKMIEIPSNLTQKRHILKWELSLPRLNFEYFDFLIVHECDLRYDGSLPFTPGNCATNSIFNDYCNKNKFNLVWAYGGDKIVYYPKDTGYPIGGDSDYKYMIMELHYKNPNLEIGYIDYFKVKYYMTTTLQPNELGTFTIGADFDPFSISIPPKVKQFNINTYCFDNCMSKYLNNQTMTIIASLPFTQSTGTGVRTKINRNGLNIYDLFYNKYYNNKYKSWYSLNPPVDLNKNDTLITYCQYNTENSTNFVNVGVGAKNEMCFNFLLYYPRNLGFKYCASAPYYGEVANLLQNLNSSGYINIKPFNTSSYLEVNQSYFGDFLNSNKSYDFSIFNNIFQDYYGKAKVVNYCNDEQDFMTSYNQSEEKVVGDIVPLSNCQTTNSTTTKTTTIETTRINITTRKPQGPQNIITTIWNWITSIFRF